MNKQIPLTLFIWSLLPIALGSFGSTLVIELNKEDRSSLTVQGTVGVSDIDWDKYGQLELGSGFRAPEWITLKSQAFADSSYTSRTNTWCAAVVVCAVPIPPNMGVNEAAVINRFCASHTAMEGRLAGLDFINKAKGLPRYLRNATPKPIAPTTLRTLAWACEPELALDNGTTRTYTVNMTLLNPEQVPVLDPTTTPPSASTCTLVSLPPIPFSSGSINIAGMRRNEQLHIVCTAGVAIDYTVRLLANSETNGRLQFDSGASAQITLNGKNLVANGEKHVFPTLVTSDIDLGIELVGSASEAGVSTATGILLLEAL
ncbi:hypothetical protein [Serratia fonticola]